MEHVLDNPIWNASITGNKGIAYGSGNVSYLDREMSVFSGLRENTEKNLNELYRLTPNNTITILFVDKEIVVPAPWDILLKKGALQMVYGQSMPADEDTGSLIPLIDKDIPAMMELTNLTKPGPFLTRTLDFGNYEGIFAGGKLIAMCGQRLQPDPYSELSAVCTHPDHLGKGYAKMLIRNQLRKILKAKRIPFLHLYADNVAACNLYATMGFTTRKEMFVYQLQKSQEKELLKK